MEHRGEERRSIGREDSGLVGRGGEAERGGEGGRKEDGWGREERRGEERRGGEEGRGVGGKGRRGEGRGERRRGGEGGRGEEGTRGEGRGGGGRGGGRGEGSGREGGRGAGCANKVVERQEVGKEAQEAMEVEIEEERNEFREKSIVSEGHFEGGGRRDGCREERGGEGRKRSEEGSGMEVVSETVKEKPKEGEEELKGREMITGGRRGGEKGGGREEAEGATKNQGRGGGVGGGEGEGEGEKDDESDIEDILATFCSSPSSENSDLS